MFFNRKGICHFSSVIPFINTAPFESDIGNNLAPNEYIFELHN